MTPPALSRVGTTSKVEYRRNGASREPSWQIDRSDVKRVSELWMVHGFRLVLLSVWPFAAQLEWCQREVHSGCGNGNAKIARRHAAQSK